jgi:hypothetical protein
VLYYPDSSASRYFAQINVTGTPAYGKCQAGDVLCYDETVYYTPITVSGSYVWQSPLATLPAGAGVYSKSSEAVALSATNYSKTVTDASGVKYAIAENLVTKAVTVRTPVFTYSAVPDGATGYDYTSSGSIFGYNFTITGQNNGLPHPQVAGKFTVTDTGSGAYGGESITWTTTPTVQTGVYTNPYDPSLNQSCTIPWTSQQVTCTNATTGEVISWHI